MLVSLVVPVVVSGSRRAVVVVPGSCRAGSRRGGVTIGSGGAVVVLSLDDIGSTGNDGAPVVTMTAAALSGSRWQRAPALQPARAAVPGSRLRITAAAGAVRINRPQRGAGHRWRPPVWRRSRVGLRGIGFEFRKWTT